MSDITKLRKSLDGYMREVLRVVPQMYVQSEGREVLGLVSGRSEAEDMEIGVDRMCEDLLEKWLIRSGFRIDLHSEHSLREIGGDGLPKYLVTCDPFDGSTHFMRGIPAEWWSVLTFWEASTMQPVLAGAADIGRQELYFADEKGVVVETAATGKKVKVFPADYSALGDHSVIATYLMAPAYLDVWTKRTDKMLSIMRNKHPKARLWPDGGACSYPWLARGLTHAYVMFDEPRTEVDPGLGFAWAANVGVYSVDEKGMLSDYQFQPGKSTGRVPWLVAACNVEMAKAVVAAILTR